MSRRSRIAREGTYIVSDIKSDIREIKKETKSERKIHSQTANLIQHQFRAMNRKQALRIAKDPAKL